MTKSPPCPACDGAGVQTTALGERRPCSRCRADAFNRWYDARRPDRAEALVLPVEPGGDAA